MSARSGTAGKRCSRMCTVSCFSPFNAAQTCGYEHTWYGGLLPPACASRGGKPPGSNGDLQPITPPCAPPGGLKGSTATPPSLVWSDGTTHTRWLDADRQMEGLAPPMHPPRRKQRTTTGQCQAVQAARSVGRQDDCDETMIGPAGDMVMVDADETR